MKRKNLIKRIAATAFGAMEVPILEHYRKKAERKGEKYFSDKIENLNKIRNWGRCFKI